MIAPIVIGNFSFNAAGLKSKGTAVKISEIIIIIIGKTTKTFKNPGFPLTLNGRGVSGSIFLSL